MKMENPNENDFSGDLCTHTKRQNHKPEKLGQSKVQKGTVGRMKGEISFLICSLVFSTWSLRHPGVQQPQGTSSLKEAAGGVNALTGTKGFCIRCFSAEIFRHGFVSRLGNHEDTCLGPAWETWQKSSVAELKFQESLGRLSQCWVLVLFHLPVAKYWLMCKSCCTWRKMWWLGWPWFPRGVICLKLPTPDDHFWIRDDPRKLESDTWG